MTSAAVLAGILEQLGARVSVLLANRFEGGYGLSDEALTRVLETSPAVLVTCDCGSSDHARIEKARAAGVDVIVVDHHLVPPEPLPALAFLNPHRPDCGFAYKGLCSAGLALSLGAAVRARLGVELDLRTFLDLVALGTIADVAPLDGDNRRLVRAGLALLASPRARPGVAALRELAKITPGATIGAQDVAFRMTPRLNAAGRLGDPTLTLSLLRARDVPEARALAARIEQLNEQRKVLEAEVTAQATAQVIEIYGEHPACGIVAAGEGWHRGVLGISAARLCDRFNVPVVVVGFEHGIGHGSARAPDGFPLFDAIQKCARSLQRYGGHQAACGLSLHAAQLDPFRADFTGAGAQAERMAAAFDVDVVLGADGYRLPPVADSVAARAAGGGQRRAAVPRVRGAGRGQRGRRSGASQAAARGRRRAAFGLWSRPGVAPARDRKFDRGDRRAAPRLVDGRRPHRAATSGLRSQLSCVPSWRRGEGSRYTPAAPALRRLTSVVNGKGVSPSRDHGELGPMTGPSLRLLLALAIGFALLVPPAQSFAQDDEPVDEEPEPVATDPLTADFKGMIGLGLIGAELGFVVPALAGARDTWVYIVFPVLGAGGGAVAGYFLLEQGDDTRRLQWPCSRLAWRS